MSNYHVVVSATPPNVTWTASQGIPGPPGPQGPQGPVYSNRLYTGGGECIGDRQLLSSTGQPFGGTQRLYLSGFIALRTESITQVAMATGGTAAGATPTLVRMGVYQFDTSGNATLLSATANDTTLFNTATTMFQRTLSPTFNKVAGVNYAVGLIMVSAAGLPGILTLGGVNTLGVTSVGPMGRRPPVMSAYITSVSDLPGSIPVGTYQAGAGVAYLADLLP